MMIFLLAAAAVQASQGAAPAAPPAAPPIIIQGQPKLVCTTVRITGSRVGRERRCRTVAQAEQEAQQSRDAMLDAGALQRSAEALACGQGTTKMCN